MPNEQENNSSLINGNVLISLMMVLIIAMVMVVGAIGVVSVSHGSGGSSSSTTTVNATLSEFKIALDKTSVPAGHVIINVHNSGTTAHNLASVGLNVRTPMIQPGATATLDLGNVTADVTLICEVPGHKDSGMVTTLAIGSAATSDTSMAGMAGGSSDWQAMDASMAQLAKEFPAKTSGTGGEVMTPKLTSDGYKEFDLTAKIVDWEIEPGKFVKAWTYNGEVPGPTIQVNVGDKVRFVLKNELPESTVIHFHGVRVPNAMDGVDPYTQDPVKPGGTFTYEFTALETAVGMYHSHHDAQVQVPNGMAGAFLIGDWKAMAMKAAKGLTGDTDGKAEQLVNMVLNDNGTLGLSLNGKSFPATTPYTLKVGETMVVNYFNEGAMTHPMHLHQPSGLVVAIDGKILSSPYFADTVPVAPGQRITVVYTAKDKGVWAWHCHILTHAETPSGMRYMVTALIVN
jgi:FtsP/CotA-like multicopper oxidase with cupredoxin domain